MEGRRLGGVKEKTRLTITVNDIFKNILVETLKKYNNNISNYIRDIMKDCIKKKKR